jgi:5-hydroxyisourate hydrolase
VRQENVFLADRDVGGGKRRADPRPPLLEAHERPAKGLRLVLSALDQAGLKGEALVETATNADGRVDQPLLTGAFFKSGRYRLEFHVAAYFRSQGVSLPDPPFLDVVTIDFGVADPGQHHHVPLLVSPFGYSTYRGS